MRREFIYSVAFMIVVGFIGVFVIDIFPDLESFVYIAIRMD